MKRTGSDDALRCSFCHKSQDVVGKLISSPSDYPRAYICDECVRVCFNAIGDTPGPSGRHSVKEPRCSFCRKGSGVVRLQSSSGDPPNASICEECLAICRDILQDIAPMTDCSSIGACSLATPGTRNRRPWALWSRRG